LSESRARSRWHRTQEKPFDRSSSESEELDQSCCGRRRWSRREHFAFVVGLALANRDDFALLWFVFSRVRDDDSTPSCADFFYSPHQNAVVQWGKLCGHCQVSQSACDPEIEVSSLDQLFLSMWAIMMLETSTSLSPVTGVLDFRRRRYALLLGANRYPWPNLSLVGRRLG